MNRRVKMAGLAVGAAALVLGACGDDGGSDLSRDELVDEMVADTVESGMSEDEAREQAECMIDEVGVDRVNELYEASEDGDEAELSDEEGAELVEIAMGCTPGAEDLQDMDPEALEEELEMGEGAGEPDGAAEGDGAAEADPEAEAGE